MLNEFKKQTPEKYLAKKNSHVTSKPKVHDKFLFVILGLFNIIQNKYWLGLQYRYKMI